MSELITVEVYKHGSSDYDIPTKAAEFIKFWQIKLEDIPEEFRSSARIKLGLEQEFGETYLGVKMTYERPKTDEEIAHDDRLDSDYKARLEATERRTLAELLAKYPDHGDS